VPVAIDFQAGLGWDAIRQRMRELAAYTRTRLDGRHGLRLTTPTDPRLSGSMTAFWWPAGLGAAELRRHLWVRRIEAIVGEWPEGLTLRVSTHFYNGEPEIDRLAEVVGECVAE